jgi:tripartite-type tricarboxylate transporter receptor subunit TctC
MAGGRRRAAAALAILLAVGVASTAARATAREALPGETVSFVVTGSPGAGPDTCSRLLEPHLERHSGADVVVGNVGGAEARVELPAAEGLGGRVIPLRAAPLRRIAK